MLFVLDCICKQSEEIMLLGLNVALVASSEKRGATWLNACTGKGLLLISGVGVSVRKLVVVVQPYQPYSGTIGDCLDARTISSSQVEARLDIQEVVLNLGVPMLVG